MFKKSSLVLFVLSIFNFASVSAQDSTSVVIADVPISSTDTTSHNVPVIEYSMSPKKYEIGGITVSGMSNPMYEDYVIIGYSGLAVGDKIEIPGSEITAAVKSFWKLGLFSNVKILATKVEGNKIWLDLNLKDSPRISDIQYSGLKKGEKQNIEEKIGMIKGGQVTPNRIDRARGIIKKYFDEKGFNKAVVNIEQEPDISKENSIILRIDVKKNEKIKVNSIVIEGNKEVATKKLEGAMKKTRHKSTLSAKIRNFLRSTNYIPESYEEDKQNLIAKYNELGYRDAEIISDTVYSENEKKVNIEIKVNEGPQYFLKDIRWVGNTEFHKDQLDAVLGMKEGDIYNQKKLQQRLIEDDDAVGNYFYYNNGYIFYQADPVEVNIENDSIDLEIRIVEGPKATIRKVGISGNDRLYEDIVRRELRTKPGALFSREDLMRSYREIAQMGHFDPENIKPVPQPDPETGTVDIAWNLASKANDQVEFSAGWGQTGIIGKLSLKFTNFSLKNLFNPGSYKGILPQGEGQTLTLSGQTNGDYYQSYSVSFMDPWFGGKRPNTLSVGAYYALQTGMNSSYYSSSYNPYSYYGYGSYGSGSDDYYYNNSLDPNQSIQMVGVSVGYGKRLNWPDDYFYLQAELSYQLYKMKNWNYLMVRNGSSNNLSIGLTFARNSTDNPVYTRRGTSFSLSAQITPPFSLFDGKDYKNMPTETVNGYTYETIEKHRWIEYHKWKFQSKTFISLVPSIQKTPVLMTRADFGLVGYFNKYKKSPFETFYVGGSGMSGYSSTYATETIALRGYDDGALGSQMSAYSRLVLEMRFPLILEPTSTIYLLGFVEAGNAWYNVSDFNPFNLKRSAGVGARIMLPMIGLMGIDWAYGFDPLPSSARRYSGGQFHFIIGQEF